MSCSRTIRLAALVSGLLFCAPAFSQNATTAPEHVPLQKTIGQPTSKVIPSLIVMNSRGASLKGNTLTLIGVSPNSIIFADRPVRSAGHALTEHLLEEWAPSNTSKESFTQDPPNATVSAFSKDGSGVRDAVVVLKSPKVDGDNLIFDVEVLEGALAGADGAASIFIDLFGVRRRAFRRGAYYGAAAGAAVAGAAAVGAAAAAAPYYHPYYAPPRCGYYPYPPCYR
jgi:hypothetical protein